MNRPTTITSSASDLVLLSSPDTHSMKINLKRSKLLDKFCTKFIEPGLPIIQHQFTNTLGETFDYPTIQDAFYTHLRHRQAELKRQLNLLHENVDNLLEDVDTALASPVAALNTTIAKIQSQLDAKVSTIKEAADLFLYKRTLQKKLAISTQEDHKYFYQILLHLANNEAQEALAMLQTLELSETKNKHLIYDLLNIEDEDFHQTLLHTTLLNCNYDIFRLLLKYSDLPHLRAHNQYHAPLLHVALSEQHYAMTNLILKHINTFGIHEITSLVAQQHENIKGKSTTPLYLAICTHNLSFIQALSHILRLALHAKITTTANIHMFLMNQTQATDYVELAREAYYPLILQPNTDRNKRNAAEIIQILRELKIYKTNQPLEYASATRQEAHTHVTTKRLDSLIVEPSSAASYVTLPEKSIDKPLETTTMSSSKTSP